MISARIDRLNARFRFRFWPRYPARVAPENVEVSERIGLVALLGFSLIPILLTTFLPILSLIVAVPQVGGLLHRYERRAAGKTESIALHRPGRLKYAGLVSLGRVHRQISIVRLRRAGSWLSLQIRLLVGLPPGRIRNFREGPKGTPQLRNGHRRTEQPGRDSNKMDEKNDASQNQSKTKNPEESWAK